MPKDLKYTSDHEWIKVEGDRIRVGITDYAQQELGDVVFVDLPEEDECLTLGDELASIESVKTVLEVHVPVSGEIIEVNDTLEHSPELINQDPYRKGWIALIEPTKPEELKGLLRACDYQTLLEQ